MAIRQPSRSQCGDKTADPQAQYKDEVPEPSGATSFYMPTPASERARSLGKKAERDPNRRVPNAIQGESATAAFRAEPLGSRTEKRPK